MPKARVVTAVAVTAVLALAGCARLEKALPRQPPPGGMTTVRLQLPGAMQAQFAGYLAAEELGFYQQQGLDVQLLPGTPGTVPQDELAGLQADYAVLWVPQALAAYERHSQIIDVGQIFARSGTYQVALAGSGITGPARLRGRKVGDWGPDADAELLAGLAKARLAPVKDVTLVRQKPGVQALLDHQVDAIQAMSYREYAQLLEATNPATGKLYTPADFSVIDWAKEGTGMLQDGIWVSRPRLHDPGFTDQTIRFLAGTIKGWAYCRDYPRRCADLVVAKGSGLGRSDQLYQMNEVNKLIWPAPAGLGEVQAAQWQQTVRAAMRARQPDGSAVLPRAPREPVYNNAYVAVALGQDTLSGLDVYGLSYRPETVNLRAGGA